MEAIAKARFQRYSSRKVGQVLGRIRRKSVKQTENILPAISRRAGRLVGKTVRCAAANLAVRLGKAVDLGEVWITSAWVGKGPMSQLKRVRPGPMGRAMPFKRKMCHLTIIVSDKRG